MTTETTIRAAIKAYASGDMDAALALCADTVCFFNAAARDRGMWNFDCHDKSALAAALVEINTDFEIQKYELVDLIVAGSRAASRQDLRMKNRVTGEVFDTQIADFWTVEDDKITSLQEFHDTAEIAARRLA